MFDINRVPAPIDAMTAAAPGPGVLAHQCAPSGNRGLATSDAPACGAKAAPGVKFLRMQAARAFALGAEPCPHEACFAPLMRGETTVEETPPKRARKAATPKAAGGAK